MATNTQTPETPGAALWGITWRLFAFFAAFALRRSDFLAWLPVAVAAAWLIPGGGLWDWATAATVAAAWSLFLLRTRWGHRLRVWLRSVRKAQPTVRRTRRSLEAAGLGDGLKVSGKALPTGVLLTVRTPRGVPDSAATDRAAALASDLRALAVRPVPQDGHGRARLLVQYSDPLGDPLGAPGWVNGPGLATDLATPAPMGRAEDGETVALPLWSSSLLIAGIPGAGKSVAERLAVAYAGCDPSALLVGADLKPGALELAPVASRFAVVASSPADLTTALRRVYAEIRRRAPLLASEGLRKVPTDRRAEFPPIVVVIDEAGQIAGDEAGADALTTLAEVLRVGRAFGVSVIAATQHPTAESFGGSTSARSLFAHRVCFTVSNASAATVVLGENPADAGLLPWTYPTGSGLGVVKDAAAATAAERLRRFRSYYLQEEEADALLLRAATARAEWLAQHPGAVSELPPPFAGDVREDAENLPTEPKRRRYRKPRTSGGGS